MFSDDSTKIKFRANHIHVTHHIFDDIWQKLDGRPGKLHADMGRGYVQLTDYVVIIHTGKIKTIYLGQTSAQTEPTISTVERAGNKMIIRISVEPVDIRAKFRINRATDVEWTDFLDAPGILRLGDSVLEYTNEVFIIDDVGEYGAARTRIKIRTELIFDKIVTVIDGAIDSGVI